MSGIFFGSPTFLFREVCVKDLDGVLESIAACGFDGLELYGQFGYDAQYIRSKCDDLGIRVSCDHIPYEAFATHTAGVLADCKTLGMDYVTIDRIPAYFQPGNPGFAEAVEQITRVGRACREEGIQLLYHNQGCDLIRQCDGKPALEALLDSIDPAYLKFQPDLGWIALGGGDPVYYLKKYGDRSPIVHLKDYFATAPLRLNSAAELGNARGGEAYHFFEFRPTGYGVMNYPALMPLILSYNPEWLVADHDLSYERDTVEELKLSLDYIKKLVSLY